ncbi:MAG: SRPBCC family protein [Marmoricola sp.]
MAAPYLLSSSTVVDASPQAAYDALVAAPLEELFTTSAGPIPPVVRCEGQVGEWGTSGATRKVVLADGSGNLETMVGADRATQEYRYRLSDFEGPFKRLITSIDGQFTFVAEGAGTRVTWTWALNPVNAVTRLALPVVGFFWGRYATAMWPRYEALAVAA